MLSCMPTLQNGDIFVPQGIFTLSFALLVPQETKITAQTCLTWGPVDWRKMGTIFAPWLLGSCECSFTHLTCFFPCSLTVFPRYGSIKNVLEMTTGFKVMYILNISNAMFKPHARFGWHLAAHSFPPTCRQQNILHKMHNKSTAKDPVPMGLVGFLEKKNAENKTWVAKPVVVLVEISVNCIEYPVMQKCHYIFM